MLDINEIAPSLPFELATQGENILAIFLRDLGLSCDGFYFT